MTGNPRRLRDAARGYNEPPTAPRDRMWERIDAARRDVRPARPRQPWWQRRALVYPVAVAASLAVGMVIGRGVSHHPMSPTPVPQIENVEQVAAAGTADLSPAARPLLARTEALLVQLNTDTSPDVSTYSDRARDLLSLTRLLLASPVGQDDELAPLLSDLELALTRVVRLSPGAQETRDLQTLQEGLTHQSVLPRLRNQLAAGKTPVGL